MFRFKYIIVPLILTVVALVYIFSSAEKMYLQVDCAIYSMEGNLEKQFNDYLCLFIDDGSRFSIRAPTTRRKVFYPGKLSYFSKTNQLVWEKEIDAHHELSLMSDKKHITFISSVSGEVDGKKIRFDVMNVADFQGNILRSWSTKDHLHTIKEEIGRFRRILILNDISKSDTFPGHFEFTHFNSFKEIPPNDSYPDLPWMQPGNFIVGANCMNVFFILDPQLKTILKTISYGDYDQICGTHDAQVLPNGNILHYVNTKKLNLQQSTLEEFNPRTRKIDWMWPADNKTSFFNPMLGSVQRLENGNTLFTDKVSTKINAISVRGNNPSIIEVDKNGEKVNQWNLELKTYNELYRARILPLERFLKNNF